MLETASSPIRRQLKGCDISHENNKLVSGTHCYILRDEAGKVWLYDSSTNGTLLNSKLKLTKGEVDDEEPKSAIKRRLSSPSIADPSHSCKRARSAKDAREADSTSDAISSATTTTTTTTAAATTSASTRASSKDGVKEETAADDRPTSKDHEQKTGKVELKEEKKDADKMGKTDGEKEEEKGGKNAATKTTKSGGGEGGGKVEEDAFAETLTCIICQELLHDCISLQPCMHSFCSGCYSEWMAHSSECPSCRGTVDRINKNHIVNNLVEAYLKEHPEKRRPEEDIKELDGKNKITRDMLYPKTRRRSSSEYEGSDVDDDDDDEPVTYPPPITGGTVFGFGTPFFGTASNAYRAVCRQCPGQAAQAPGIIGSAISAIKGIFTGNLTTTATTADTTTTAVTTPSTSGTNSNNNNNNDTNNNANQPSTSGADPLGDMDYQERDKKTMPDAPPYTCAVNQNHVLCQCCLQIFPDRRAARVTQPEIPPQQCTICFRAFCHAYWGCRKADCNGCLAKFKDMNFGRKVLPGLILDNNYESDIFTNYLDSKKLAVRDVLEACIAKMAEGSYSCPDQVRYTITGETPLCFACGLRNFKSLAYQYRADIPRDQLPVAVSTRSNCYWGKNCRTQRNKPAHAMRYNHICEQTRT